MKIFFKNYKKVFLIKILMLFNLGAHDSLDRPLWFQAMINAQKSSWYQTKNDTWRLMIAVLPLTLKMVMLSLIEQEQLQPCAKQLASTYNPFLSKQLKHTLITKIAALVNQEKSNPAGTAAYFEQHSLIMALNQLLLISSQSMFAGLCTYNALLDLKKMTDAKKIRT